MQKRMREILALVLLAVLLVVGVGAMGWYIIVGHNWNVAASTIDDSIGQMDGYTVFVFEGTRLPDEQRERVSDQQPLLDEGNRGVSELDTVRRKPDEALDLKLVADSYREKGATVFTLATDDLRRYQEPYVVSKNGLRVGLFSIEAPARPARALVELKLLRRAQAQFMVGVTDDESLCEAKVNGLDLLVCTDEAFTAQGYIGSVYCVSAPLIGEVQAVIRSPSGVLSTKTIAQL